MGRLIMFTKETIVVWEFFIKKLIYFIEQYRLMADSYISDFFTQDLWSLVIEKWREPLEHMSFYELSKFINIDVELKLKNILPLSLLAYRATCSTYSLSRKASEDDFNFKTYFDNSKGYNDSANSRKIYHKWNEADLYKDTRMNKENDVHHIFRVHLKPKKQHEVSRLSHVASLCAKYTNAKVAIDVGSGQGHLSRRLSYFHNIPSVCIETEEDLLNRARKFDLQLERYYKKIGKIESIIRPIHRRYHIDENLSKEQLKLIFEGCLPKTAESESNNFLVIGLHSCGDLGSTLIKTFCALPNCVGLISVACCYMKLSTSDESMQCGGYPLSRSTSSISDHELSYNSREIACHAIESYCQKLQRGADDLKIHCYRSVLEQIIVDKYPELRHSGLKPVKNGHLIPFSEYAPRTLSRLRNTSSISFDVKDFETDIINHNLTKWKRVVIFFSIRLMLAPAIETLILLDRMMYLYEEGYLAMLAPIFDPKLSPRNFVIMATKNKEDS